MEKKLTGLALLALAIRGTERVETTEEKNEKAA